MTMTEQTLRMIWRRAKARRLWAERALKRATKALAVAREDETYAMFQYTRERDMPGRD